MRYKKCVPIGLKEIGRKQYLCLELDRELGVLAFSSIRKRGGFLSVDMTLPRVPRTTGLGSQNHAINGYCSQIARETGNDFSDVKLAAKLRAVKRGYPLKKDEKGEYIISLITGEPEPESEAKLSTVEAGYLIDELIQIASELGIILEGGAE